MFSVNHRVTEFLASYFDIIFALNEMTHPGEKRMQTICSKECNILPNNFDANLYRLFDGMFRKNISGIINDMVDEIKKITQLQSNSNLTNRFKARALCSGFCFVIFQGKYKQFGSLSRTFLDI